MEWSRLISDKRLGLEEYHDPRQHTRSDFQRDYDRLVFSSPFRRLQNKTQVFPLPGSVFVHNRLTHSLEVSSVGRSMANSIAMMLHSRYAGEPWADKFFNLGDIVATACLAHDMGNPPFGHNGEKTIATYFSEGEGRNLKVGVTPHQWSDMVNFEGNANSFRLLTHQFVGRRNGGFALTYSALAAVVKYPHDSLHAGPHGKFGFFSPEVPLYERVATELGIPSLGEARWARHPLVWIMEAADDICYQIMDIEDAHRLKILSLDQVKDLLLRFFPEPRQNDMLRIMERLDDPNEKVGYMRSNVIGTMVDDCARVFVEAESQMLAAKYSTTLIRDMQPRLRDAYQACSRTAYDRIYCAPEVVDIEIAGNRILTYLLDNLIQAVIYPDRNFSKLLLEKVPRQYDVHSQALYDRVMGVLDHVSGMTDVYALDLFRKLNGHSLPAV
ncbi:MAG: dNTP triphosphohydrolase [Prevotella sp.]|nr:dNTP triphosphohydrolase [Prevotella sp.]MCM1476018.1 dNTP triphosphohydrolase [Muribaculaceae bacterium]